jgi:hypothetical protein
LEHLSIKLPWDCRRRANQLGIGYIQKVIVFVKHNNGGKCFGIGVVGAAIVKATGFKAY